MDEKKTTVKTFKLEEGLAKTINALAKKHGRTVDGQIRELIRLGVERDAEADERVYRKEELADIVGKIMEEKMANYTITAKDGQPGEHSPGNPQRKRNSNG